MSFFSGGGRKASGCLGYANVQKRIHDPFFNVDKSLSDSSQLTSTSCVPVIPVTIPDFHPKLQTNVPSNSIKNA